MIAARRARRRRHPRAAGRDRRLVLPVLLQVGAGGWPGLEELADQRPPAAVASGQRWPSCLSWQVLFYFGFSINPDDRPPGCRSSVVWSALLLLLVAVVLGTGRDRPAVDGPHPPPAPSSPNRKLTHEHDPSTSAVFDRPMVFLAALLSAAAGCDAGRRPRSRRSLPVVPMVDWQARRIQLEVAADDASRDHGLMERDALPAGPRHDLRLRRRDNRGIFWMKHTRFPLDIIFADHAGKVVSVHSMKPYDLSNVPERRAGHSTRLSWPTIRQGRRREGGRRADAADAAGSAK